jgi:hypothetical protein
MKSWIANLKHKRYWLMWLICFGVSFWQWNGSVDLLHNLDTPSYFKVVSEIKSSTWPNLTIRPPVYPLYLTLFMGRYLVIVNMIWGGFGGVLLLWLLDKMMGKKWWSWPIALLSFADYGVINFQNTYFTESIVPTIIMLFLAANLMAARDRKLSWKRVAMVAMANLLLMYVKPGFYWLPLGLMVFLGLFKRKVLVIILILEMLLLPGYNFFLFKNWTISEVGRINGLGVIQKLGYFDWPWEYKDASVETKKQLDIYSKYLGSDVARDPWKMDKIFEKEGVKEVDLKYFYIKNWKRFLVSTTQMFLNTWTAPRGVYAVRKDLKYEAIYSQVLNPLKLWGFLAASGWWLWSFVNKKKDNQYLGAALMAAGYIVLMISTASYSETARFRMPVDWILNMLVCLIPFYAWRFVKIGYDQFHRRFYPNG